MKRDSNSQPGSDGSGSGLEDVGAVKHAFLQSMQRRLEVLLSSYHARLLLVMDACRTG